MRAHDLASPLHEEAGALSLKLVTRSGPPGAAGARTVEDLAGRPFTIGRDGGNDWTLSSNVVSRHHCTIEQDGERWILTDTSTNGVYVGDAVDPVGNGNRIELTNGLRLHVGDYELEVLIDQPRRPESFAADADLTEMEEVGLEAGGFENGGLETGEMKTGGGLRPDLPPIYEEEERVHGFAPLPRYDVWERRDEPRRPSPVLDRDHPTGDDFDPPRPLPPTAPSREADLRAGEPQPEEPLIPNDWFAADGDGRVTPEAEPNPRPLPLPPHPDHVAETPLVADADTTPPSDALLPQPTLPESAPPEPAAAPATTVASAHPPAAPATTAPATTAPAPTAPADSLALERALEAFFAGAGIAGPAVSSDPANAMQTMRAVGEILRCVTDGTIQLLDARSQIKGEMGVEQTVLAAHGNNPLKFSGDAGQALQLLLDRDDRGYLPPQQAFAEAFEDIVQHELSLLTGVRDAWHELLDRVDPEALEQRVGKEKGLSGLLVSSKARCWDVFRERYREIVEDADRIFRLKVASAYERQKGSRRRRSR